MTHLLIGLPGQRPGGLTLSILLAALAAAIALGGAFVYASVCVAWPRWSLPLQAMTALLRGVPLILLVVLIAQLAPIDVEGAALLALSAYSFAHVGEIIRSFLASYPKALADQGRVTGLVPAAEWARLRVPWAFFNALSMLTTHWISLLKDTGALVVLGIGELTTVAKILSETPGQEDRWATVLVTAGVLYFVATQCLVQGLKLVVRSALTGARNGFAT